MLAKTTTHRQRYWLKHVEAADLSDGTIAEYASDHDISLKGLYTVKRHRGQWKTKLMKLKLYRPSASLPKSEFVPVKRPSAQALPSAKVEQPMTRTGCTVTLANGARVDFHGELSAGVIRSIMTNVSQSH